MGQPGDRERLRDFCPRVSAQSRRLRFHGVLNELSEPLLDQLMDVDHHHREALVALDGDRFVGVARYAVVPGTPDLAEVTVLVADAWQRRGVAARLMTELRETATGRGIRRFKASVLPHNDRARRLIGAFAPGHEVVRDEDALEFRWNLPTPADDTVGRRPTAGAPRCTPGRA
ncbi:GNAT family N-acetyltransferase [Streptomyces sp. NPDC026672]